MYIVGAPCNTTARPCDTGDVATFVCFFSYVARPFGTGGAVSLIVSRPLPFSAFVYLLAAFSYVRCDEGDFGGSVLVETLFVVGFGGAGGADTCIATVAYVRSSAGGGTD